MGDALLAADIATLNSGKLNVKVGDQNYNCNLVGASRLQVSPGSMQFDRLMHASCTANPGQFQLPGQTGASTFQPPSGGALDRIAAQKPGSGKTYYVDGKNADDVKSGQAVLQSARVPGFNYDANQSLSANARSFQSAYNAAHKGDKGFTPLAVDGKLGVNTLGAARNAALKSGFEGTGDAGADRYLLNLGPGTSGAAPSPGKKPPAVQMPPDSARHEYQAPFTPKAPTLGEAIGTAAVNGAVPTF